MADNRIGLLTEDQYANIMRNRVQNSGIGSTAGFEQTITTTTQIVKGVVDTLYYELMGQKLSDFVKIEVGTGAYATNLTQFASTYVGSPFKAGIINPTASGINADANTNIKIGMLSIPNNFWRMKYNIGQEAVRMAARNAETFSLIEENEKARKKTWDLGLQEATFMSDNTDVKGYGLLKQPNVTVNTTLMTAELDAMSDAQFQTFLANVCGVYAANSNGTMMFDRMLIPQKAFLALQQPYGSYGETRLSVMERAFKGIVGDGFKVVHATYCTGATAGGNASKGRYVFYNSNEDNLIMHLPKPYTPYLYSQQVHWI
jgi:hypothetical protein